MKFTLSNISGIIIHQNVDVTSIPLLTTIFGEVAKSA